MEQLCLMISSKEVNLPYYLFSVRAFCKQRIINIIMKKPSEEQMNVNFN